MPKCEFAPLGFAFASIHFAPRPVVALYTIPQSCDWRLRKTILDGRPWRL